MKIRFGETTRGSGKVYVHVVAEGAPEGCTMEVDAVTRDGAALPARCLTVEGVPGWVVVLPLLGVSQRVIVSLFDTDGTLLAGAAKVVNPLVANVSSKVNTLRRNEVALAIRNCDEQQRGDILLPDRVVDREGHDGRHRAGYDVVGDQHHYDDDQPDREREACRAGNGAHQPVPAGFRGFQGAHAAVHLLHPLLRCPHA